MRTTFSISGLTVTFALTASALLLGCTQTITTTHGQVIDTNQLEQLAIGAHTKEDVRGILGSPSVTGTFHDDRWYYITETKMDKPLNPNILTERGVYIVTFDKSGIVTGIDQLDKEDGKEVIPAARTTTTQGQSLGIVDQLLENLGQGF